MAIVELLPNLPKCPKCGSDPKGIQLSRSDAWIECSRDASCYHTKHFLLNSGGWYGAMGDTDEMKWMYIQSEWIRLALEYPNKKMYRDELNARRCVCGKVIPKKANFCPKCGKSKEELGMK